MIHSFTPGLFSDTCCLLTMCVWGGGRMVLAMNLISVPSTRALCLQEKFSKGINILNASSLNQKTQEMMADGKGR